VSRILLIEDDQRVQAVVALGLSLGGHEILRADNLAGGREAWETEEVDVVILDLMLPDGDGIDLLAERRSAGDSTPVLLLTARDVHQLGDRAVGASAHLGKPFAYAELLDVVQRLASGDGAAPATDRRGGEPDPD
jgi:two-component system response regulator QseB